MKIKFFKLHKKSTQVTSEKLFLTFDFFDNFDKICQKNVKKKKLCKKKLFMLFDKNYE